MKKFGFMLLLLSSLPGLAYAWWNDDWEYKKKISLDTQKLTQEGIVIPNDTFALVRLSMGNFLYFNELSEQGKDIRFLAEDETTPLKFFIEKIDKVNQLAYIWVKLPKDISLSPEPAVWMYYGNEDAVDGQDAGGTYDVSQVLSYQFKAEGVKDTTANGNHPSEATATIIEAGLIGDAAVFNGGQIIRIPASPSLLMSPVTGWTLSTWLKIDQDQADTVLLQRSGGTGGSFTLSVKGQNPILDVTDQANAKQQLASKALLTPKLWHQLVVAATAENLLVYLDGALVDTFPVKLNELNGDFTLGADANGARGFVGSIDQFNLYNIARDANSIKFDAAMQGFGSTLVVYGEDLSEDDAGDEGENYFVATFNNVTIDGWVIIGILGLMLAVSVMVIVTKTLIINTVHRQNKKFEKAFSELGSKDLNSLNSETSDDDEEFEESPLMFSLTTEHDKFSGSSIYRIYHVGVDEMNKRIGTNGGATEKMSASSMTAVKAAMEAVLVRELQKLNSQMILLTIAISGGPFLGLLGTVLGVMITFTAIAISGEVNVNTIAPGIAAALTTTVVGLAVAIPAMFAYNYLGSRIKTVTADMQVFVDEFIAKLAEQHT